MAVIGVGIDVVDIERFMASLARTTGLRERLFTAGESALPPGARAAPVAAQEARANARRAPTRRGWPDAEVVSEQSGRPVLTIRGSVADRAAELGVRSTHLSLSHDAGIASAVVVL